MLQFKKYIMTNFKQLYEGYAKYNILFNQLNLPSPSVDYAWRKTKVLLYDEALSVIKAKIHNKRTIKVCDVGCGNGALLIRIAQSFQNKNVSFDGFDLSKAFANYANQAVKYKKLHNIHFYEKNIERENLATKYDLIICSEVIEHIQKPSVFIEKMHNSLEKNGYFLISTPNSNNLIKYPFKFLRNNVIGTQKKELQKTLSKKEELFVHADEEQHIFVFSHENLKKELKKHGFETYNSPRSTTLFGGPFIDNRQILFGLLLIFDAVMDHLPFKSIGWDNVIFSKKPSI